MTRKSMEAGVLHFIFRATSAQKMKCAFARLGNKTTSVDELCWIQVTRKSMEVNCVGFCFAR